MKSIEFKKKRTDVHGDKYEYLSYLVGGVEYNELPNKISLSDKLVVGLNGMTYSQTVSKHLMGRCPEKMIDRKTTEQYIKEAREFWGNKYDYSKTEYKGALGKVIIIYDGIEFEQVAVSHLMGMSVEKQMNRESFIKRSKELYGDKYDYSNVEYISCDKNVLIGYNGRFYSQKPKNHLSGNRPENISMAVRRTKQEFIDESNLVHDYFYIYDKVDYVRSNVKVTIICPSHGDFELTPNKHLSGSICPNCNHLDGEYDVKKFLDKYDITYSYQHRFDDCYNDYKLPFDFYIPSMRVCIEFDHREHPSILMNDIIKNEYCEDNYINLLRVGDDEIDDIYSILWSTLGYHIRRLGLN
jgi:hypothetical protein